MLQPSLWKSEFKTSPKRACIPSTISKFQPLRMYREPRNGYLRGQIALWDAPEKQKHFPFSEVFEFLSKWSGNQQSNRGSCSHKPAVETDAEGQLPVPGHHLAPDTKPHPVFSLKWKETEANEFPSGF